MSRRAGKVRKAPSLLVCLALLALTDLSLRCFGLRRSVQLIRKRVGSAALASVQPGLVTDTVRAVVTAAAFYPRRALCLEQSLVLFWVLRSRGVAVELRVGVQPFPFTAHAWVEHNGHPLNEHEEFVRQLSPFPSFGA